MDVKNHPWLRTISWSDLEQRKLRPPYIPKVFFLETTQKNSKMKIILIQHMQMIIKGI